MRRHAWRGIGLGFYDKEAFSERLSRVGFLLPRAPLLEPTTPRFGLQNLSLFLSLLLSFYWRFGSVVFFVFRIEKPRVLPREKVRFMFSFAKVVVVFIGVLVALFFVFRMGKIAGAAEQKEKRDSFFGLQKLLMFLFGPFLWIHEPTH